MSRGYRCLGLEDEGREERKRVSKLRGCGGRKGGTTGKLTEDGVERIYIYIERGKIYQLSYQSRRLKGNIMNISLTDSTKGVIVDFVKNHKELCDKSNELCKNKVRKDSLWESFARRHKFTVQIYKRWSYSQRQQYGKLSKSYSKARPRMN